MDLNKPCIFPFSNRYLNEKFLEIEIPINVIRINAKYPKLVLKYMELLKTKYMGPLWLSIGRKMADNTICVNYNQSFRVIDGNHRAAAYKRLRVSSVRAIIPESHNDYYRSNGAKAWQE